jgi:hypothetical protein
VRIPAQKSNSFLVVIILRGLPELHPIDLLLVPPMNLHLSGKVIAKPTLKAVRFVAITVDLHEDLRHIKMLRQQVKGPLQRFPL